MTIRVREERSKKKEKTHKKGEYSNESVNDSTVVKENSSLLSIKKSKRSKMVNSLSEILIFNLIQVGFCFNV